LSGSSLRKGLVQGKLSERQAPFWVKKISSLYIAEMQGGIGHHHLEQPMGAVNFHFSPGTANIVAVSIFSD